MAFSKTLTSEGCAVVLVEYPVHIPPDQTRLACESRVGGAGFKGYRIRHHRVGGGQCTNGKVLQGVQCSVCSWAGRGGELSDVSLVRPAVA